MSNEHNPSNNLKLPYSKKGLKRMYLHFLNIDTMFWNFNTTVSQIDSILAKEDVTLQEVLDSEDIINDCRLQNKNLIDFLQKPEIMEELVTLTTREPSLDLDEKVRFKYPNIASELLTCDIPTINERLARDESLLEKLYAFLENDSPLNPLLASFFSKIMGALIARSSEQVLHFLKAKETFLPLLLKHLGTSAIMDLALKLMTQVEGVEMCQNTLNWLDSQMIIQKLVIMLNPKMEKEKHDNVAQLLCDFIRIARDSSRISTERADLDPLVNTLESSETICLLLDQIFSDEKCESAIVGGIQVLLALLDVNQPNITIHVEKKQRIVDSTMEAICTRIKDFHDILLNPPKQPLLMTTVGTLDPPLGNTRLHVVKLLSVILAWNNNHRLLNELRTLNTFTVMLDLFFKYSWNNFLHAQVENCLLDVLHFCEINDDSESSSHALCKHLIVDCKLVDRLLQEWKDNDEQEKEGKRIRQGYMGHVISIVNNLVELCESTPLGKNLQIWQPETVKLLDVFKETTLAETNKMQDIVLGGADPKSSVEDNDEYGSIPSAFPQQLFSSYQTQNLTYIDSYGGFNDDAYNDGDGTLQTIENPSDANFELSENDLAQKDEFFKQICAQKISTFFDADDQIFEDKEHTFQTVIEKQGVDKNDVVYTSGSDDDSPENMDVDPWTSPKPVDTEVFTSPDPWATRQSNISNTTTEGWADFSLAAFDLNTIKGNDGQQRSTDSTVPQVESESAQTEKSLPQDKLSFLEEGTKSAAGDQEQLSNKGGEPSVVEPSSTVDGESCKLPTASENGDAPVVPDKDASTQKTV
ncbi:serine/threonine-protein phosphatase 6 regulatory subunit 3 isoform X2 [Cylas formicarius]|uniref:serine/threonine-protein phosphatase 6 regulatory subunit 3 isoform X2 n=1 Tax=Cylas formicarius TaxID=197179 RepID=UPI002958545B|nr:serine/threonine-protein phosphatase 6 regulatory subunit 3 isoform X2 [Cylas formicarius]